MGRMEDGLPDDRGLNMPLQNAPGAGPAGDGPPPLMSGNARTPNAAGAYEIALNPDDPAPIIRLRHLPSWLGVKLLGRASSGSYAQGSCNTTGWKILGMLQFSMIDGAFLDCCIAVRILGEHGSCSDLSRLGPCSSPGDRWSGREFV